MKWTITAPNLAHPESVMREAATTVAIAYSTFGSPCQKSTPISAMCRRGWTIVGSGFGLCFCGTLFSLLGIRPGLRSLIYGFPRPRGQLLRLMNSPLGPRPWGPTDRTEVFSFPTPMPTNRGSSTGVWGLFDAPTRKILRCRRVWPSKIGQGPAADLPESDVFMSGNRSLHRITSRHPHVAPGNRPPPRHKRSLTVAHGQNGDVPRIFSFRLHPHSPYAPPCPAAR